MLHHHLDEAGAAAKDLTACLLEQGLGVHLVARGLQEHPQLTQHLFNHLWVLPHHMAHYLIEGFENELDKRSRGA